MDDQDFADLYVGMRAEIFGYAARRTSRDVAEVVVSETFEVVWAKRDVAPVGLEDIRPWVYGIARNKVWQMQREQLRGERLSMKARAFNGNVPVVGQDVAEVVIESDLSSAVWKGLSPRDRETVQLVLWEGLSAAEAAAVIGCSVSAFTTRLLRARRLIDSLVGEFSADRFADEVPQGLREGGTS